VGFRYFVCSRARELDLAGWVRNRLDGSVELRAEGSARAIETLVHAIGDGPTFARVSGVSRAEVEPDPELSGFRIRS
jgi:acylphosphatase